MKKLFVSILMILSLIQSQAQNPLSLSEAIQISLENNYDLRIQQNSEEIAGINNSWGNTSLIPGLSFSTTARENYKFNDNENYRTQTLVPDISLNWVVFNGFSAKINKRMFEELEQQSKGNTVILVENTIQDIILAYNNCLLQKELISVYKELSDLSEDRYQRSLQSAEIGAATSYENTQFKTSWLADQSNYLQQKVNFDNAVRTLNFLMGTEDNKKWTFTSSLIADTTDYDIEDLKQKLLKENATLKNQYLYQSLLAKETQLSKSSFYPTLSLNTGISNTGLGNYYAGNTPDYTSNASDAYIGLTLSWSIFNGGTRKRSVEIAKINEESAQVQTEQMEHSLGNQLLQSFSTNNVQKALLNLAEEQEASARLNLNLSEDKFKNGSINSFNYRDAQIMYMNAAISKYTAIYNLIQSNTGLLRITGGIISEIDKD